jgi:cell wall-associated NlpC family hydrolase
MHLEGFSDTVLKGAGLSDQIGNTEKTVSFAVKGGDVIGYVGNTGGIQNPHLHFQVGPSGSEKDPAPILDSWLSGAATPTRSSEACPTASPSGNSFGERVVNLARTQLGKAYIFGSCHGAVKSSPPPGGCSNYDCSSFVEWSWYWGTDKKFDPGGTTGEMWGNKDNTAKWSRITDIKQLQPGDILLRDGHVMLASGKGTWIEAPQTGDVVKESAIRESRLQKGNYVYLRPNIQ